MCRKYANINGSLFCSSFCYMTEENKYPLIIEFDNKKVFTIEYLTYGTDNMTAIFSR